MTGGVVSEFSLFHGQGHFSSPPQHLFLGPAPSLFLLLWFHHSRGKRGVLDRVAQSLSSLHLQ